MFSNGMGPMPMEPMTYINADVNELEIGKICVQSGVMSQCDLPPEPLNQSEIIS